MKTYKHWFWLGLQALFAFALLFGLTSPAYADIPDPKLVWAKGMGSSEGDGGDSITIDSAGNVYTLGTFTGTVDFDPGPGTVNLTSKGQKDFFISKLDTKGNLLWAKAVGGTSDEWDGDIALDGAGNVYITGYFSGVVDFDPGAGEFKLTSFGNNDIFVSKLNSSGSSYGPSKWGRF